MPVNPDDVADWFNVFQPKLWARGFRRIDPKDGGLHCVRAIGIDVAELGIQARGFVAHNSSKIGPVSREQVTLFPTGDVKTLELCLRPFTGTKESSVSLRLSLSWVNEDVFWPRLAWLLDNAVEARHAYECGIPCLLQWQPRPFEMTHYQEFFL